MLAFPDFPKASDILAIARIESTYNEKARNGISRGVMQVNHGPWDLAANVQAGVKLLREYYEKLGSIQAAVMAYNIGIGNYLKGKRNFAYFDKFKGAKHENSRDGIGISGADNSRVFSTGRVFGSSGGPILVSEPKTCPSEVFGWEDSRGYSGNETSRQVSSGLGEVKEESWDSSSDSS